MEGEIWANSAEDGYEVVFRGLDGLFRPVAAVVVWWYQLIRHACIFDGYFVVCRYFVVQNLVFGFDAAFAQSGHQCCQSKKNAVNLTIEKGFDKI